MNTLERLERANPVADSDRLLSASGAMDDFVLAVKQRSGIVKTTKDQAPIEVPETQVQEIDPNRPIFKKDRRRGLVYGLAAALVVLMLGSVVWAVFLNDSEPDVAPQPAPTPTTLASTPTTITESAPPAVTLPNLEEVLAADGRFTTYLELWDIVATAPAGAGVMVFDSVGRLLRQSGTMTLFVPTDEAFAALPAGYLDDLKTTFLNPQDLPEVCAGCVQDLRLPGLLGYLSLPVRIGSLELASRGRSIAVDGTSFVTNQSSDARLTVGVDADGNTVLGGTGGPNSVVIPGEVATIIEADLEASNGIIHVVDTVLIPPNPLAGWDVP